MNSDYVSHLIGEMAVKAILYEVSAAPKPGLVDRMDRGAHRDMDYFTFVDSAMAIGDDFRKMAYEGCIFKGTDFGSLFHTIREIGKETEEKMFLATGGVNTHKGIIFSIGILSAIAAYLMVKDDRNVVSSTELCGYVPLLVGDLTDELKNIPKGRPLTHGEKLYQEYGITGVRGEVSHGFPTVLTSGLPAIRFGLGRGSMDQVLVSALLSLMCETQDSNVLHRQGMEGLLYVQDCAKEAMEAGGMFTVEGRCLVEAMIDDFRQKEISPGGSADLLAVSVFVCLLEGTQLKHCEEEIDCELNPISI